MKPGQIVLYHYFNLKELYVASKTVDDKTLLAKQLYDRSMMIYCCWNPTAVLNPKMKIRKS